MTERSFEQKLTLPPQTKEFEDWFIELKKEIQTHSHRNTQYALK